VFKHVLIFGTRARGFRTEAGGSGGSVIGWRGRGASGRLPEAFWPPSGSVGRPDSRLEPAGQPLERSRAARTSPRRGPGAARLAPVAVLEALAEASGCPGEPVPWPETAQPDLGKALASPGRGPGPCSLGGNRATRPRLRLTPAARAGSRTLDRLPRGSHRGRAGDAQGTRRAARTSPPARPWRAPRFVPVRAARAGLDAGHRWLEPAGVARNASQTRAHEALAQGSQSRGHAQGSLLPWPNRAKVDIS